MALKKCKECGKDISTKAESCPNCGAKQPKKTSLFTWLVLVFFTLLVYGVMHAPKTERSPQAGIPNASTPGSSVEQPKSQRPSWRHNTQRDAMTNKLSSYASSPRVEARDRMTFPYSDVVAWLAVGCDYSSQWAYFGFSTAPNLNDTETEDGYSVVTTRVRWDDSVVSTRLIQKWGDVFLHFSEGRPAIAKIAGSSSVLLELDWHGQRPVYFDIPLDGSRAAIESALNECSPE